MIKVLEKNEGPKIDHEVTGTMVFLGDQEIMINAAKYQRDWPVHLDICSNRDKQLAIGTGEGLYYAAEIDIPAKKYTEPEEIEGEEGEEDESTPRELIPLDMKEVTLTLWSIENQEESKEV